MIRPHDQCDDRGRIEQFLADQGFGHLVACGLGHPAPVVVPTQYVLDRSEILCHLSAANPVFDRLLEDPTAVLSVAGDWTYIPGAFKAVDGEDPRRQIPTTFYAAVQVTGRAQILDTPEGIAAVLRRQLAILEPDATYVDPLEHGNKLRGIRGIRLPLAQVSAKFKYGGNVDQARRSAIADRLSARDGPGDRAALVHLRRTGRS